MTPNIAAVAQPITAEVLRRALSGRIEPVRVTLAYRAVLLLVAVATVLLPLAYLGFAGLVAWSVVLHGVHNQWILHGWHVVWGPPGILRLIAYGGPIVGGLVVVVFLFKPLLARPSHRPSDLAIDVHECPLLFALVDGICRAVHAPMPSRITVDCHVNASASFREGFASFFYRDLQLTIGLPLVTGLTLRELAGVVAHEMGHFAQGSGMRLTYLVRSINAWLARVVYERDAWDEALAAWSTHSGPWLGIVLMTARLGVWMSRNVLWVLMNAGHAIGMLMLRQMEYDADRYEVRLAGSGVFESTALAMRVLTVSAMKAMATLEHCYTEGRLTSDFPALIAATRASLPPDLRRSIEDHDDSGRRPGVFDTHPPDAARIASAREERAEGIIRLEHPAVLLFDDLAGLCRRATELLYRAELRDYIDLERVKLEPPAAIFAHQEAIDRDQAAYHRLFGGLVSAMRPLQLELQAPATELAGSMERLRASREAMERLAGATRATDKAIREAYAEEIESSRARMVLGAGYEPPPATDGLDLSDVQTAERATRLALEARTTAEAAQAPARAALRDRVHAALSLLGHPEVSRIADGADDQAAAGLLNALAVLDAQASNLLEMSRDHAAIDALMSVVIWVEDEQQRRLRYASMTLRALDRRIGAVLRALEAVPYPFEHAGGPLSLAAFAAEGMPPDESELSAFLRAGHLLAAVQHLHARTLGRVAVIVEDVEKSIGLPLLGFSSSASGSASLAESERHRSRPPSASRGSLRAPRQGEV